MPPPDFILAALNGEQLEEEPSYQQRIETEVYVLRIIAPLIEGSVESKEAVLSKMTERVNGIDLPEKLL